MAAVGLVGSVLLSIVSRKLAIGEDERLRYLARILPGANCGSCGHPAASSMRAPCSRGQSRTRARSAAIGLRSSWLRFLAWSLLGWCGAPRMWPARARGIKSILHSSFRVCRVAACSARCRIRASHVLLAAWVSGTAARRAHSTPSPSRTASQALMLLRAPDAAPASTCARDTSIKLVGEGEASAAYVACMNTMGVAGLARCALQVASAARNA